MLEARTEEKEALQDEVEALKNEIYTLQDELERRERSTVTASGAERSGDDLQAVSYAPTRVLSRRLTLLYRTLTSSETSFHRSRLSWKRRTRRSRSSQLSLTARTLSTPASLTVWRRTGRANLRTPEHSVMSTMTCVFFDLKGPERCSQ